MRTRLRQAWETEIARVRAWQPGTDPEPVLSALGLVLVLDLGGDLEAIDARDRSLLRERGGRALLSAAGAGDDEDDLVWAREVARAGLDRLSGRPARPSGDPLHPSAATLGAALVGEPDGLSAGSTAAHVERCDDCRGAIAVLRMATGDLPEVAVAAGAAEAMRPPAEGRVVGRVASPEVEAVWFGDGRLAIYASAAAPVRFVADGVTTEHMMTGYWLGRVGADTQKLSGRVHVGEGSANLEIDLTDG